MQRLQAVLILFTLCIFAISIAASVTTGFNWPAVFLGDLLQWNWSAQFGLDLLMHLLLLALWAWWREGGGLRGGVIGFFCVIWGGMFSFPYLIVLIARNRGDAAAVLLGVHRSKSYVAD